MEHPKYHEIISPIREIVHGLGNFVLDKILPTDVISDVFNGVQQESVKRTAEFFQPSFQFDDQGNWHNPDGLVVPDVSGKDL